MESLYKPDHTNPTSLPPPKVTAFDNTNQCTPNTRTKYRMINSEYNDGSCFTFGWTVKTKNTVCHDFFGHGTPGQECTADMDFNITSIWKHGGHCQIFEENNCWGNHFQNIDAGETCMKFKKAGWGPIKSFWCRGCKFASFHCLHCSFFVVRVARTDAFGLPELQSVG